MTRDTLIRIVRAALMRGYQDPAVAVADAIEVALMMESDAPPQDVARQHVPAAVVAPPIGKAVVSASGAELSGGIWQGQAFVDRPVQPAEEKMVGDAPLVIPEGREIHSIRKPSRKMSSDQLRMFLERKAPEHIKIRPIGKEDVELTLDRNIVFMPGMSKDTEGYKLVYAHPQFADSMQVVHTFFASEQVDESELSRSMEDIQEKARNMYKARPRTLSPRPGTGRFMEMDPARGGDADSL